MDINLDKEFFKYHENEITILKMISTKQVTLVKVEGG